MCLYWVSVWSIWCGIAVVVAIATAHLGDRYAY
jgi:hypothetical protein